MTIVLAVPCQDLGKLFIVVRNVWKIQSLTLNQSPIQQIAKSQLICFNFSKLERLRLLRGEGGLNYLVFLKSI